MNSKTIASLFGSSLVLIFLATGASGQAQRTFVSSTGSDSNSCSRLAPCRTFAQAISQTNAGGEVIVLDSAGYGPVSVANGTQITKAISLISPPGVYAGISVFSGDGIDINAGGSDTVTLRGLTVNNQGSSGNGVVFNTGLTLHVEGCVINGFSSGAGDGLSLLAGGAQVDVVDSVVRGNNVGIFVAPSSGTEQATIDRVRLEANFQGLFAREGSQVTVTNSVVASNAEGLETLLSTGSVQISVESTAVTGNTAGGIAAFASGTGAVQLNVARCVISNNGNGITAGSSLGAVATVRLSGSTVTGNGTGLNNTGSPALILSRGDNTVEGNATNTSGTIGTYSAK
jgi:hypothetical protein